jgi:hypothetical protein
MAKSSITMTDIRLREGAACRRYAASIVSISDFGASPFGIRIHIFDLRFSIEGIERLRFVILTGRNDKSSGQSISNDECQVDNGRTLGLRNIGVLRGKVPRRVSHTQFIPGLDPPAGLLADQKRAYVSVIVVSLLLFFIEQNN